MVDLNNQRIFFSDNGTFTDFSVELSKFRTGSQVMSFVAADDALFIGSHLPMNHKFIKLGSTKNAVVSAVSISVWFGNSFEGTFDILDQTAVSGASLAQDGILRWTTDRQKGWERELDSDDVTGLETAPLVYNMYWIRLKWSADLTVGTTLSYIGHKFSNDDELFSYYPDLSNSSLQTAFESGKSDWEEQEFTAADQIIRDLRKRNIVKSPDQILDFEKFMEPSVHKVAEIVYGGLGKSFKEDRDEARKRYSEAIDIKFFDIDMNRNARIDDRERDSQTGFMTR